MINYPITYGNLFEKSNGLTSETVFTEISKYWSIIIYIYYQWYTLKVCNCI